MKSARPALVALVAALTCVLAGCGDFPTVGGDDEPTIQFDDPGPVAEEAPEPTATEISPPMQTGPVLYDGEFVVVEGVWNLSNGQDIVRLGGMFRGQRNGLLAAGAKGGVSIWGPALYGKYSVRITSSDRRPRVPAWCEDVVEVSYEFTAGYIVMGSFDEWTDPMRLAPGTYRLRYCASGLDATVEETAEDEFDGDDYRLYSSRHLFQLWPAPAAPDEVLRVRSEYAEALHARAASG